MSGMQSAEAEMLDPKTRCAVCSHWMSDHDICDPMRCKSCDRFAEPHEFMPRRLAGGAYTPDAEKAAYEKAMRGE